MFRIGRWGVFLLLLLVTLAWAAGYAHLPRRIAAGLNRQPEDALEELLQSRREIEPEVANSLRQVEDSRKRRALAIVLRAESRRPGGRVSQRARLLASGSGTTWDLELAHLALDPERFGNLGQRREFLLAHGTTLSLLDEVQVAPAVIQSYVKTLQFSMQDGDRWASVRSDPIAMLVLEQVADPKLQEFYLRERSESDWLDEVIVELSALEHAEAGDFESDSEKRASAERVLSVVSAAHPLFKQSLHDYEIDLYLTYALFARYGDVIRLVVERGVPLDQALEVLFANEDSCSERLEPQGAHDLAAYLIQIHSERPSVWREARFAPLALRLYEDAPAQADEVLEKYGDIDVAALLYSGYEDEVPHAADCVVKFGDLAIYILARYAEEPEDAQGWRKFHESLKTLGARLIPYTARFDDAGLERLQTNAAWLDKYFHEDGTPKEEEWWTTLPGGGAAKVTRNWIQGYPNEWSELGWAAVDVADGALLIASFGTSGTITAPGKAGAKQIAKQTVIRRTRGKVTQLPGPRHPVRPRQSLLKASAGRGGLLQRAEPWMSPIWRTLVQAQRTARASARAVLEPARQLNRTWRAVDPATRRLVYRSLLAAGLFVTLTHRTLPNLPEIGKAAGSFVADVVDQGAKSAAALLSEALGPLLDRLSGSSRPWVGWGLWLIVLFLLGGMTWKAFPKNRKVRYA